MRRQAIRFHSLARIAELQNMQRLLPSSHAQLHKTCEEQSMITRFPGLTPTRSRAVATDDLVFTVAVAPDPVPASVHEQSVKVLARVDESLALCGSNKSKILAVTIYLADVTQKKEFNRAWDAWIDPGHPPMRACIGVDIEPPHLVEVVVTAAR
jgi:enamine deaminase RidA (YjgF/YER057c/UK114 family)